MQRHRLGHAVTGAALAAVLALGIATSAAAQGAIGLIYMNGKQGPTNSAGSNDIAAKAAAAGIKVIVPSMPWGRGGWEKISVTPDEVFGMIDGYANQLRAQGAQRIVVGGQSLGANVALSYAVAARTWRAWSWRHRGIVRSAPIAATRRSRRRSSRPASWRRLAKATSPSPGGGVLRLDEPARPGQHAGPGA